MPTKMKLVISILLLLTISISNYAQITSNETAKIATFCKVWGFLKYYHPEVAKGTFDWDRQLIEKLPLVKTCNTKEETSRFYLEWINSLGNINICKHRTDSSSQNFTQNLNIAWINDTAIFSNELISKLNFIKDNRSKHHYYVKKHFTSPIFKEKTYKDSIFPSEGLRMVGLFRYWNIINYFFPYKYLTDNEWNDELIEMIPEFQFPEDTVAYHHAMYELVSKVNDSHASFSSKYTRLNYGNKFFPYQLSIVENKLIVIGYFKDSLCKLNGLEVGDVITQVESTPVEKLISDRAKQSPGSNESFKQRNLANSILTGKSDSIHLTVIRQNQSFTATVLRYLPKENNFKWNDRKLPNIKDLDSNIGYVNMAVLKRSQVKKVMRNLMDKKTIIFDLRCYPNGTGKKISKYLNKEKTPFSVFLTQDLTYPGMFYWSTINYCGKNKNVQYYKGNVIVLINENTQSQAEFTCMAFKTAPNVTFIGSQTAGADGNVSQITFPGGYNSYFSGIGVYYPDGTVTQRVGILPDIEVKPTIEGIRSGKDEVFEKAIEFAIRKLKNGL